MKKTSDIKLVKLIYENYSEIKEILEKHDFLSFKDNQRDFHKVRNKVYRIGKLRGEMDAKFASRKKIPWDVLDRAKEAGEMSVISLWKYLFEEQSQNKSLEFVINKMKIEIGRKFKITKTSDLPQERQYPNAIYTQRSVRTVKKK